MTGIVFDVQRFSVHDGPGIRTTVFLKGCSNRCSWCHNPESLSFSPELRYEAARCIHCSACVEACPHGAHVLQDGGHTVDRNLCKVCGRCIAACHAQVLWVSGRRMTVEQVMSTVMSDRPYYARSGGGMTLSGGEPVLQADFAAALLTAARACGIRTAIETAGNYSPRMLERLLPYLDLVLFDLKVWSDALYERHVGADRRTVLQSLRAFDRAGVPIIARTPVVGGVNDDPSEIDAIAGHLQTVKNLRHYELIPYHALGTAKLASLGYPSAEPFTTPSRDTLEDLERLASRRVPVFNRTRGSLSSPALK